jgi:hypothetical protein
MRAVGFFSLGLVSLGLSVLSGCSGEPFVMAPVAGKVTLKGGKPLPRGDMARIYFDPDGIKPVGNVAPKTAEGEIKEDGSYSLKTDMKVGAAVGSYRVRVHIPKKYPNPEQLVPKKYTAYTETPWKGVEVKPGSNDLNFEVEP